MFRGLWLWASNMWHDRCGEGKHLIISVLEYEGEKVVRVKRFCLRCDWKENMEGGVVETLDKAMKESSL